MFFASYDWLIVAAYLIGVAALGFYLSRGQRSTRDYFLGNRNLPWWSVGLSIIATETSALTFVGVPAMAYTGDLSFLQIILGYVIARIVLAVAMVPHYFKGEIYSPYQILHHSFGRPACTAASALFLVAGMLAAGVRVYVTAIPLQVVLNISLVEAILLFGVVAVVYTMLGGVKAVIWSDVVQFCLLFGGGIFALCFIPTLLDAGWTGAIETAQQAGKLHWFNPELRFGGPYNIWMGLIGASVMVMFSHGADQLLVQRLLTCRSVRDGRKALILSAVIILPLFAVFLCVGLLLWLYYQHHPFLIQPPVAADGSIKGDYIFPIFIVTSTPTIIKGLLVAGIFAAAMSSVDSALSALGSVSVMDIYKPFLKPEAESKHYLTTSRKMVLFWGVILVVVAYLCKEVQLILETAFSLSGLTSGALLGGLLWAITHKSERSCPIIVGMIISFIVMVAVELLKRAGRMDINWPWYPVIGTAVTLGVTYAISMKTKSRSSFKKTNVL